MNISSLGFFEKLKLAPVYSRKAQAKGLPAELLSDIDKIDALETAVKNSPNEWVYWYAIADNWSALGSYSLALNACEKCLELKPDDPRSSYAIATLYRALTRARFIDKPQAKEVQNVTSDFSGVIFDPKLSASGLKQIGISIEEAARRSMQYFEQTLKLRINRTEEQHIRNILKEFDADFPSAGED